MTHDELISIVAKASTLFERLGNDFESINEEPNERQIQARLTRWQDWVAKGDAETWKLRLKMDSLDTSQIRKVLGPVRLVDNGHMPAWASTLSNVVEVAASISTDELRNRLPPPQAIEKRDGSCELTPVRFEAFVLPFLEVALRKLRQLAGEQTLALLTNEAFGELAHEMLSGLSGLCWRVLQWEFAIFRSPRRNSIFYRFIKVNTKPSTELYQAFVRRLLSDGLAGFFQRYPVLARLMATRTQLWAEAISEFLIRLRDDSPRLSEKFLLCATTSVGRVKSLKSGLSDPHNRCRMAASLIFESGIKVVYKPRNLGLEKAWFEFLGWLNAQGLSLKLKTIGVLDCGTHGWVEFVPHEPLPDVTAVQRYYHRVGMQIALLHILEGTDFHQENIIACGEQPVLVDQEMILHPRLKERTPDNTSVADRVADDILGSSVLRSGLLPRWTVDRPGQAIDFSGLGSMADNQMPEFPQLEHINSDNMEIVSKLAKQKPIANEVIMDSTPQSAGDHIERIVGGFKEVYSFLIQHRNQLGAPNGPLSIFRDQCVRFVYRPTRSYGHLLQYTLQTRYLHDGVDRSIELDMLSRRMLRGDLEDEKMFPLLQHEVAALERLDVPIFHAWSNEDCLRLSDSQIIRACFREPSDTRVLARLHDLSEDDCHFQTKIIRSSFYSRAARHADQTAETTSQNVCVDDIEPLSSQEAFAEAMAIGEELRKQAIVANDGSATWLGLEFVPGSECWQLQPLGRELYGGTCGVALFLATLEEMSGDGRFRDITMGAMASLQKMVRDPKFGLKFDDRFAIGGAVGLGSYIYALVRIGQRLGESELLDDAALCSTLITDELIESDENLDVIAGSAGAILGLLTLHEHSIMCGGKDNSQALTRAIACGQHLLANRTSRSNGPRAWKTIRNNDRMLTGFSHGAAGIAYALLRLFQATGDEQYKLAAVEAMDYERATFSVEQNNWPDFRKSDGEGKPSFLVTWCHGAPGIGLARSAGLTVIDTLVVHQEIEAAISAMLNKSLNGRDHICCGTMGISDILLSLASRLSRPELETRARQQAAWAVRRARKQGYKLLDFDAADAFIPGMFQGLAGIGYALLRLVRPGKVKSVLLWE